MLNIQSDLNLMNDREKAVYLARLTMMELLGEVYEAAGQKKILAVIGYLIEQEYQAVS